MTISPQLTKFYEDRYRAYHGSHHPKIMSGKVPSEKIDCIAALVSELQATCGGKQFVPRLLDYGSGKGYQYLTHRIHERWGGSLPTCYDPGVVQLSARPQGVFDGVLCTDVLEHIEEEHLRDVVDDIFGFARPRYLRRSTRSFVYLHICCRPAHKHFPDGTNLHATVKPPTWWNALINVRKPDYVKLVTTFEVPREEASAAGVGDLPAK